MSSARGRSTNATPTRLRRPSSAGSRGSSDGSGSGDAGRGRGGGRGRGRSRRRGAGEGGDDGSPASIVRTLTPTLHSSGSSASAPAATTATPPPHPPKHSTPVTPASSRSTSVSTVASAGAGSSVRSSSARSSRHTASSGSGASSAPHTCHVEVLCRFRPLSSREESHGGLIPGLDFPPGGDVVTFGSISGNRFNFDRVFDMSASQREVYERSAAKSVKEVLRGYNCTVFVYGQTGSGKTHTMVGPPAAAPSEETDGIVPRMVDDIFQAIEDSPDSIEFTAKVSYVEVYMESIRDLLDPSKSNVRIREEKRSRNVFLEDVTERYATSREEILALVTHGGVNRAVSATRMNTDSSRSHAVLSITLESKDRDVRRSGKLYLVDLAGSEVISKTGAAGQTLEEAKMINKSLSALGNVIKALTESKPHIPYRDSKLTRLLQGALGGDSLTTLIVTASPAEFNEPETLSTLRFGTRAKKIRNRPLIHEDISVAKYKLLLEQMERRLGVAVEWCHTLEKILRREGLSIPPRPAEFIDSGDTEESSTSDHAASSGSASGSASSGGLPSPERRSRSMSQALKAEQLLLLAEEARSVAEDEVKELQSELALEKERKDAWEEEAKDAIEKQSLLETELVKKGTTLAEAMVKQDAAVFALKEKDIELEGLRAEVDLLKAQLSVLTYEPAVLEGPSAASVLAPVVSTDDGVDEDGMESDPGTTPGVDAKAESLNADDEVPADASNERGGEALATTPAPTPESSGGDAAGAGASSGGDDAATELAGDIASPAVERVEVVLSPRARSYSGLLLRGSTELADALSPNSSDPHNRCKTDLAAMTSQFIHVKEELAKQVAFTHELLSASGNELRASLFSANDKIKELQVALDDTLRDRNSLHEQSRQARDQATNQKAIINSLEHAMAELQRNYRSHVEKSERRESLLNMKIERLEGTVVQLQGALASPLASAKPVTANDVSSRSRMRRAMRGSVGEESGFATASRLKRPASFSTAGKKR